MASDYVAFLRGISNVPMQPFREALERLGLAEVRSFGMSGNLIFRTEDADADALSGRIADATGADAFVFDRSELARVVADDPFWGREGAAVFLAAVPIGDDRAAELVRDGFDGETPVVSGRTVYFVHPVRRPGHKANVDFERSLGMRGTMRSSGVLARVLELMG